MFLHLLFEKKIVFNKCGSSVFPSHLWIISIFLVQLLLIYFMSLVGSNIRLAAVTIIIIIKSLICSSLKKKQNNKQTLQ